jgi:hypothetical protein
VSDERAHWTDPVLNERFRAIDQRFETVADAIDPLTKLPDELARSIVRSEDRLLARLREVQESCADIRKEGAEFRREYRRDKETRERHAIQHAQAAANAEDEQRRQDRDLEDRRASRRTQAAIALLVAAVALIGTVTAAIITSGTVIP